MASRRYMLPREPFAEMLENAILERQEAGYDYTENGAARAICRDHGMMGPVESVIQQIARYNGKSRDAMEKAVRRIRHGHDHTHGKCSEVKEISLEVADQIACALGRPFIFYEDPRLKPIYEQIVPTDIESETKCPVCRAGFTPMENGSKKKFCSRTCKSNHNSRLHRERKKLAVA